MGGSEGGSEGGGNVTASAMATEQQKEWQRRDEGNGKEAVGEGEWRADGLTERPTGRSAKRSVGRGFDLPVGSRRVITGPKERRREEATIPGAQGIGGRLPVWLPRRALAPYLTSHRPRRGVRTRLWPESRGRRGSFATDSSFGDGRAEAAEGKSEKEKQKRSLLCRLPRE